jgi:hypothetical protein
MVAATNANLPPGVTRATAGPRTFILNVTPPPRGANVDVFADQYRKASLGVVCRDARLREALDIHGITLRISVAPVGQPAVTRDIVSSSCAGIGTSATSPAASTPARSAEAAPRESTGTAASPAGTVMTGDELEAIAKRVRSFVPRDQFDTPPSLPSVTGGRFSYMVMPLERGPSNLICDGYPSWGFWPQDGRLEVGATEGTGIKSDFSTGAGRMFSTGQGMSDFSTMVTFRSFRCQKTRLPSYTATNGFGAQFTIEKSREVVTAIGGFAMPNTSWKTHWTKQVTGEAARQLSRDVRVRISGTLVDWAPGRPVRCGTKVRTPTTRLPYDETLDICLFNGSADLFEVIDARTGEVLFSSPR